MFEYSVGTPLLWIGFTVFVMAMLVLDINVFQSKTSEVTLRQAQGWTLFRIGIATLFGLGVYIWFDTEHALAFATGYIIEQALSIDNLFVFLLIFTYFKVPTPLAHRVLFWGVLGAIVIRALFILLGTAVLHSFRAAMYLFGFLVVLAAAKLLLQKDREIQPEKSLLVRLFR
jgi:tellurite resistance protein TerC